MGAIDTARYKSINPRLVLGEQWTAVRNDKRGYHGSCPFCGGDDRFVCFHKTKMFYCSICQKSGDSIQLAMLLYGYSFIDACKALDSLNSLPSLPSVAQPIKDDWSEWQKVAHTITHRARDYLKNSHTENVRNARKWLKQRGITGTERAEYQIGYIPEWQNIDGFVFCSGLTVSWLDCDYQTFAINTYLNKSSARQINAERRRKGKKPIKRMFTNHCKPSRSFFGIQNLTPKHTKIIICEGELDTILVNRFIKEPNAIALGVNGSSTVPKFLSDIKETINKDGEIIQRSFYYLGDNDKGGDTGFNHWSKAIPSIRRITPPQKGDITENWKNGANVTDLITRSLYSVATAKRMF